MMGRMATTSFPSSAERESAKDMVWVEGGQFNMGSDHHYPEEAPRHTVRVDGFWIDRAPVTNRQFAQFVEATGHVTTAEIAPDAKDYPGALPEMLKPGSLLFVPTACPVDTSNWSNWWTFSFGADWRHPLGPESSIDEVMDHPVVHVTHADASAYAGWAGKCLPTEAQWEYAAWGGLDAHEFAWGDELEPEGRQMANVWQGEFPWQNHLSDGYERTSPVGTYPANGFGLHDMIGNVWEWTEDWFRPRHPDAKDKPCCIPTNPRGGPRSDSHDRCDTIAIPRKVVKGGSHLCAPSYCRRYRPAARHPQPIDSSASHIGFRCIRNERGEG
jgi:formylglycine-generating enzyme required for sulfatase activity